MYIEHITINGTIHNRLLDLGWSAVGAGLAVIIRKPAYGMTACILGAYDGCTSQGL
jgi:hypothetical protein